MISIVNYGMGNLRSVQNAFTYLGADSQIVDDPAVVSSSRRIVLPGVGSFARAMHNLKGQGLGEALNTAAEHGAAILGICLGMQLLATVGDEDGPTDGLGFIPGRVVRIDKKIGLKIPHVGFNGLRYPDHHGGLFYGIDQDGDFYFIHSYQFVPDDEASVIGTTHYGAPIVSAVRMNRILGVQFHPEKSQSNGLRLLRNFLTCY